MNKIKLWHVLVFLGLIVLLSSFYVPVPLAVISLETPIGSVRGEGLSEIQVVKIIVGTILILIGIWVRKQK
ncbi:MAG: hypothetical protein Q7S92_02350 [Candidatus Diapherotrites archaeon]|nr:hypothetical protein [Candidatus Diapherotrites archaeon]